jgi:dihydroxyacetone kinase-like protein
MGNVSVTEMVRDLKTRDLAIWLSAFATDVTADQARLSALDASSGDADHGANLARGARELCDSLLADVLNDGTSSVTPGDFLKQVGLIMVDTIGGSSGALYGTVFLRMAATVGPDSPTISVEVMSRALRAATEGIADRGGAKPGDKTMLDALDPAATAFAAALAQPSPNPWVAAADAAARGADATIAMRARRGKASYVGDMSVGTMDPGAASVVLLFAAAARTI